MASVDNRPDGARVQIEMIGSTSGPQPIRWSEGDTMLYALGVGAGLGDPERELLFTTENSGGVTLRALPSFLSVLVQRTKPPALGRLDIGRFLHGEQRIALSRPLPPSGTGTLVATVEAVWDKGEGAIVDVVITLQEGGADGARIGEATMSIFVRGAGGFGGPRGTAPPATALDRAPDLKIVHRSRPEQALLYRLSGDRHRLHSDPPFARERGFDRPILHGLSTYGFACRALVEGAAGGDPARLTAMRGRFRKPVYPGETLTTELWIDGQDVRFRTLDVAGDAVIERGLATVTD